MIPSTVVLDPLTFALLLVLAFTSGACAMVFYFRREVEQTIEMKRAARAHLQDDSDG